MADNDLEARTITLAMGTDDGTVINVTSGGSSKFSVDSDGNVIAAGTTAVTGATTFTAAVTLNGGATFGEGDNIAVGTSTGTKIGTATSQKIGFFNATPVVQQTNVADPSGGATQDAEARTAIAAILTRLETLGLFAAS